MGVAQQQRNPAFSVLQKVGEPQKAGARVQHRALSCQTNQNAGGGSAVAEKFSAADRNRASYS